MEKEREGLQWTYGAVPLGKNEIHDKVLEMIQKELRGKVLDVPCGTGILGGQLRRMAFEVSYGSS